MIFSYKRRVLAAFSRYKYVEKLRSYQKFVRKMFMKLTPVGRKRDDKNDCNFIFFRDKRQ
jgi:hypothetical protein